MGNFEMKTTKVFRGTERLQAEQAKLGAITQNILPEVLG
jgi:hypothetical protein